MRRNGFTFIELIVVMGIIALSATMFMSAYRTFSRKQTLKKETQLFVSTLNYARKQASSRQAMCATYSGTYQVSWTTSAYTVTPTGCSAEISYTLPSMITIDASGSVTYKTIALSSATECVILQDSSTSQCRKVSISASGIVDDTIESDCNCP